MDDLSLSKAQLDDLGRIDTCMVSNAIETFDMTLRNTGFADARIRCMFEDMPPIIGYAATARLRTGEPPITGRMYHDRSEWWNSILQVPAPRIAVVEDMDKPPGVGAFLGDVHAAILRALGCVAYVTDGAVRELPRVRDLGFQVFAGSGGAALLLGRQWRLHQSAFRLLIVLLALSLPMFAMDRRHGEFVTVAANETVDDTLLATGNTVVVEGVVNGDLLVLAQDLEVRGNVKGDVVSLAKRTVISGTVEGRIFDCSRSMELDGELGHSLYYWGQSLRVERRAHVGEGIVAGGNISIEGEVKRSATLYGEVEVSGAVGRDLLMAGRSLTLTNAARVGGNVTARVHQLKEVHIADGASISGKRDIQLHVRKNQFTRARFYLHQVVWLAAAMLVGWLGLALFPGFFQACTQAVGSGWRSAGIGLGVLAGIPVAIVVVAITLVGIPISLMLLAVYLAAIYLAKLWVGALLGRILLKPAGFTKGDWLLGLLVGLVILTIVGFIPYLGGLVRLVVVCLGLGAFAWQLYQGSRPGMTS